jgi:hypothetical protein
MAIEATVASGHGVQVIEVPPGTGKTYTAGVLRHGYQRAGSPGATGVAARVAVPQSPGDRVCERHRPDPVERLFRLSLHWAWSTSWNPYGA